MSFGLVAIWCMHFIGNRAIVLGDGEAEIQLYYNATFVTASAILPIVVIYIGLLVADYFNKANKANIIRYSALIVCGILSGAAVTGMHYLGNNGTVNYHLKPKMEYLVGATAIAIAACTVAFTLFFHWSSLWMNNMWRRALVSCFLAIAVSGMHWTAAAGTTYELKGYHAGSGSARNVNMVIAICLVGLFADACPQC